MIKKFFKKPILYIFSIFLYYFSLILLTLFTGIEQDIIINLLFSAIIIFSCYINYYFLSSNYEKFYSYSNRKKIISAIISFIIVDIFGKLVEHHLIQDIFLSLCMSFCALIFSFMFVLFSALAKNKSYFLSKTLYNIGIGILFVANIMAIINLFSPFV